MRLPEFDFGRSLGRRRPRRKPPGLRACVILVLILAAIAPVAHLTQVAAQTNAPAAARESVLAERRLAAGYLRTLNGDLAALALERLARALQGSPHAALATDAVAAIDAGDLPRAAELVEQLGEHLAADRRMAGTRIFTDCIREASTTYRALDVFRVQRPDLSAPATRTAVADAARASDAAFARCESEAPAAVRADPDFRRLIDGARASLGKAPQAATASDGDLLHRLLIELRSFEQLLLFRFG